MVRLSVLFPDWKPWYPRFCLPIWQLIILLWNLNLTIKSFSFEILTWTPRFRRWGIDRSCIHPLPPAPLDSVTITLGAPLTSPASSPAALLRAFSGAAQACAERAAQACAEPAARNPLPFQALAPCCPLVREHLHTATAYSFGCQLRCYHEAPLALPPHSLLCSPGQPPTLQIDQELLDKISTGHEIQFLKFHGIKLPLEFSKLFNSLIIILIETFTVIAPMFFLYPQASIPFLSLGIVIG